VQFLDGKLLFSASDLVNFLGCQSWLEVPLSRRRAEGRAKAK
jgi:hypothetical protein